MYLLIDIGNTRHKAAVTDDGGHFVSTLQTESLSLPAIEKLMADYEIKAALISATNHYEPQIETFLSAKTTTFVFSKTLKLPITIDYTTPSTLGTDRIACAVGANALFPNQNVLVIQTGTCLVLDFINAENIYLGGSIAPGLEMRLKALPQFTDRLPLVKAQPIDFLIGNSTHNSILSGVINGFGFEIDGWIARYKRLYPSLKIIITGGDTEMVGKVIKSRIFAAPNLVLSGLYKILRLNVSEI